MQRLILLLVLVGLSVCQKSVSLSLGSQEDFMRLQQKMRLQLIDWPFQVCDNTSGVEVFYVQMAQAPKLGSGADIAVTGQANEAFTENKAEIKVYYKNIYLTTVDGSVDLPKTYAEEDPFNYQFKVDIPSYAFKGHYRIQFNFYDSNNKSQLCLNIEMDL